MKAGDIIDVYKTRFKKLSKYYHNLPGDFGANDIHHFRLEIKKLRAFIRLINISPGQHQHKIPKGLKSFYNLAGNIRNLQLHQHRIIKLSNDLLLEAPGMYLQYLHKEEKAMRKQARQIAENLSFKDFQNKLIEEAPERLTKDTQNDFIQKNRIRLHEILTLPFYADEALHEVRKILKDLVCNFNYISVDTNAAYPGLQELKSMEAMTSALGDFHDLCVGLSLLSSLYVTRIAGMGEAKVLNELRIQLQSRKDVMKTAVIELLTQLKQQVEKEPLLLQMNKQP